MDLREQRIENEWALLERMAEANPSLLVIQERRPSDFVLLLRETTAVARAHGEIQRWSEHEVKLSFARFFPTMPIEAYLTRPVFHPNVHPDTGFVCLWGRFSLRDTVVEALCQLQRVVTYSLFSESADHIMQPEALKWTEKEHAAGKLPFPFTSLAKPMGWMEEREFRILPERKRLS
jgi:ubiquitin-protein ligase